MYCVSTGPTTKFIIHDELIENKIEVYKVLWPFYAKIWWYIVALLSGIRGENTPKTWCIVDFCWICCWKHQAVHVSTMKFSHQSPVFWFDDKAG